MVTRSRPMNSFAEVRVGEPRCSAVLPLIIISLAKANMLKMRLSSLSVLAVATLLGACNEASPTGAPLISSSQTSRFARAIQLPVNVHTIREDFRDLSVKYPGFTGIFFDSAGRLTISAAVDDFPRAQRSAVLAWASAHRGGIPVGVAPLVRRVPFDYATLYETFTAARRAAAAVPGFTEAYIDETRGRIVFGGINSAAIKRINTELSSLNAAAGMIEVDSVPPVQTQTTLHDVIRPILPGTQITRSDLAWCTMGPTAFAKVNGQPDESVGYFFTSSHCGYDRGVADSTVFDQPTYSGHDVGFEVQDAPLFTSAQGCAYALCQDVDAAAYQVYDSLVYGMSWGYAAKSSSVTPPTLPPYNGVQLIRGTVFGGAYVGTTVDKVGARTGQTTGVVKAVCVDHSVVGWSGIELCSTDASYGASEGDSGSPVWIPYNPNISGTPRLAGMHWGTGSAGSSFSPIDRIMAVFGSGYAF